MLGRLLGVLFVCIQYELSKFTPFEVMFGRQAVLPIEVHVHYCTNTTSLVHDKQLDDDEVEIRMLHQRKVLEVVKMNIAAAQTRQKEQYDRKHYNPDVFEPGSIVLKKYFRRKKSAGGKQDFTWLGPYRIVKSLAEVFIEL